MSNMGRKGGSNKRAHDGSGPSHGDKSRRVQFVENADYTKKNLTSGRRERHNVRNAWKRILAGTQTVDMRFSGIAPFDATGGFYQLANSVRTVAAPVGSITNNFPCHVYDISSFAVNKAPGGVGIGPSLVVAKPLYIMCAQNPALSTNRQIVFQNGTGIQMANPGSSTDTWQYVRTREGGQGGTAPLFPTNSDAQRDILQFVNAKMLFYGRQNIATKFTVQLVQMSLPTYATPKFLADLSITSFVDSNSEDRAFVNTVWENFVSKELYSPIQTFGGGGLANKFFKVLKSHTFVIQGSSSVTQLHQHQLNLFHRFNRRQKYDWQPNAIGTGATSINTVHVDEPQTTQACPQETGTLHEYVHPRARIYLVIKAQSTCNTTDATLLNEPNYKKSQLNNPTQWPSYDMNLNVRHAVAI
ncbi:MAG: capsid protein [Cressdnaviricota sp.]|nr:MAG: capsid protein [Cressdnaviricota sp.]